MFLNCLAISGSKSAATGEEEVGDHIKHCIQESLEWIFEKQWQSEKVPEDWKEADGKAMIRGANQSRRKIQVTAGWSASHLSLGRLQSKPSQKFIHASGNDKMMECRAYQRKTCSTYFLLGRDAWHCRLRKHTRSHQIGEIQAEQVYEEVGGRATAAQKGIWVFWPTARVRVGRQV